MHCCNENGRFVVFLVKGINRRGQLEIKYILVFLIFSEAVLNYIWYQAILSIIAFQQYRPKCLIFQIVLTFIVPSGYRES